MTASRQGFMRCSRTAVRTPPTARAAPRSTSSSPLCPASTPTFSCSTLRTSPWAVAFNSCTGRESGLCRRWPLGFFSTSSKRRRVLPLPAASSKMRSVFKTFFVGMASFAASSLSAARSERRIAFCRSGEARSSSVNFRREEGRCRTAEPSRTVSAWAFAAFFAFRRSWARAICSAAAAAVVTGSCSAERSTSASRLLMFVTSPVARFSATAPSWVIFCVTFSDAFSSFMLLHLPFRRDRY